MIQFNYRIKFENQFFISARREKQDKKVNKNVVDYAFNIIAKKIRHLCTFCQQKQSSVGGGNNKTLLEEKSSKSCLLMEIELKSNFNYSLCYLVAICNRYINLFTL